MATTAMLPAFGRLEAATRVDVVHHLDYPAHQYADVPDGGMVGSMVLLCDSNRMAEALVEALGFGLFEFERHWFQATEEQVRRVREAGIREDTEWSRWIDDLDALRLAGFVFWFQPNC